MPGCQLAAGLGALPLASQTSRLNVNARQLAGRRQMRGHTSPSGGSYVEKNSRHEIRA